MHTHTATHTTLTAPTVYHAPHTGRALDGDVVAVELLPQDQWKSEAKNLPGGAGRSNDAAGGDNDGDGDAEAPGAQVAPGEHYDDGAAASSGRWVLMIDVTAVLDRSNGHLASC
jgi:hypothetical protein